MLDEDDFDDDLPNLLDLELLDDDDDLLDDDLRDEEEEEDAPPSVGGDKKRKAAPTGEAEGSKKGRTLPPDCSANTGDDDEDWPSRAKPLARS